MKEKWEEIYSAEQIKKIQTLELKNLQEIKRVCQEIGVEFFLYGGSLIGAVRHNGFVPWDDDLDIAMLREDYEKFVSEAPKYLSEEFFLQNPYTDKKTPYFYTKLRLIGTKCVEYGNHFINIEHGIYVDIYPVDFLPEDDTKYKKMFEMFQKAIKWFVIRQNPYQTKKVSSFKKKVKALIKRVVSALLHLIPLRVFIRRINAIMTKYNETPTKRIGNYSFPEPVNFFSQIYPLQNGIFEGEAVNLPYDWDEHLRRRYGNYMELPPEEKRVGHLPYVLDFGKYQ